MAPLAGRLARLEKLLPPPAARSPLLGRFDRDPAGYAREVLGSDLWSAQEEICAKLFEPPYKVLAKACHSVGKTWVEGLLVNWFFDTHDPSVCITTAPTSREVKDLLWSEVRMQRARKKTARGGFRGVSAPELWAAENHYAKGYTAGKGESFQGRHHRRMLFLFDEAVGVESIFWTTAKSMFKPDGLHHWLCCFNPTDVTSQAYAEELAGKWHIVQMAAPEHPNLAAELLGQPPPFPDAVSLAQFEEWLHDWADPVPADEATPADVCWPPAEHCRRTGAPPRWYRPGPLLESRGLGRWPSQATYSVWSDAALTLARTLALPLPQAVVPQVGCDTACFGDDFTSIHARLGPVSVHHERHNGWAPDQTAGRLKQVCRDLAALANANRPAAMRWVRPEEVPVKVEADGLGQGVISQAGQFNFVPVSGSATPHNPSDYNNTRSELWFNTALAAKQGRATFPRLPQEHVLRLRQQAMAPQWKVNGAGQCQVERKEETKRRLPQLGSPDDMDACNLAYYEVGGGMSLVNPPGEPRERSPW